MSETLVRAERTVLDALAVYAALQRQVTSYTGARLRRESALVLLAQVWLETGAGASSFGYNLAGIKHVPGDGHDYYQIQTHEVVQDKPITIIAAFRSYPSLDAAASDFVRLLRTTFGYAWPAVEAADCAEYAHRLRARGYFTAPEAGYASGLRTRYAQLEQAIPPDEPETQPDSPRALADGRPAYVAPDPERDPPPDAEG